MKIFICLATISTTFIALFAPAVVRAQGFPYGGSSTTTIYVPPTQTTTTTITTTQVPSIDIYPNTTDSFGTTTTTSYGSGYPVLNRRVYNQPTVIFQQQNIYPRRIQSSCSTTVLGSPIPSPIALDRSGRPCN
jgi:hypothetical protein